MGTDITKNDDYNSGREKGNNSGVKFPVNEGNTIDVYNNEMMWSIRMAAGPYSGCLHRN